VAESYRVLGQAAPAAATEVALYTVPAATTAVLSTLSLCNRSTTSTTFRVAVCPAGAATAAQHYLYYDAAIGGNVTVTATLGLTLPAACVLRVYSPGAAMTMQAFGVEIV
jgi:hypothetical protein